MEISSLAVVQIEIPFIQTTLARNEAASGQIKYLPTSSYTAAASVVGVIWLLAGGSTFWFNQRLNIVFKHRIPPLLFSVNKPQSKYFSCLRPAAWQELFKSAAAPVSYRSRPNWSRTQTPRLLRIPPPSAKRDLRLALNDANRNRSSSAV